MTNNQTIENLSKGFGNSVSIQCIRKYLNDNYYELSGMIDTNRKSKEYGDILHYNLSSLEYDWNKFCMQQCHTIIEFDDYSLDIENNENVKKVLDDFIKELLLSRKLMSRGIRMTRHFFHDHLEKFLNFNNNPYITVSCTEDKHDIVNTEYVEVNVILTKRVTLEKLLDYIKLPSKYDDKIALQRNKHFGIRKQQDFQ